VDIRVIAATHRDLEAMITEGKFRDDLYFRLNVFPIAIPSLQERKGDIPSLVHHFMQKKSREIGMREMPSLAQGALERLRAYPWPGNVRELGNMVERALILSRGKPLSFNDFQTPLKLKSSDEKEPQTILHPDNQDVDSLALDKIISGHIRRVLDMTSGRVGGKKGAASLLNINSSTLRKKMRKLGIPFGRKAMKGYKK